MLRARRARAPPPRGARYIEQGVAAASANPPATSAPHAHVPRSHHTTQNKFQSYAMPMAAIQTYQTLGVNKLAQHQLVQRKLAPAPVDTGRCKKKTSYLHQTYPAQPASVARRNARERNRVKQVNNGFAQLRQHIPSAVSAALAGGRGASRKLSKVDTLRLAVEYIRSLKRLLEENDDGCSEQATLGMSSGPQTPPSSETSHSPAPSFISEGSAGPTCHDVYDSYEPMSPEDEELLDVISWWQQQ